MKNLRYLLLLVLAFVCLATTASAATIPGQQSIAFISDTNGYVSALTDDDPATAWTQTSHGDIDLTINMHGNTVGEIWIRSGYAYTQNWYSHYDRPDTVKVTVHYQVDRYTESYDVYRYQLVDAYRPSTVSANWFSGYQRLLLPKQYTGVTRIDLTIEETFIGFGNTGATVSDIAVAAGSHATATPKAYATATPKPYVVYVTPTPGPWIEEDDFVDYNPPEQQDYVEYITPRPTEPLVELITPPPAPTREPINYPSAGGIITTLAKRVATRSGPGTRFDEPGSFFSAGDEVKVFSKAFDKYNNVYWYQIEFKYKDAWYRAYTTESYLNINRDLVPEEPAIWDPLDSQRALKTTYASFGPGDQYLVYRPSVIHTGSKLDIYAIEDGWALIEYVDYGSPKDPQPYRRGWVPLDVVYEN